MFIAHARCSNVTGKNETYIGHACSTTQLKLSREVDCLQPV